MTETIRLTVNQAIIKFMQAQYVERDGENPAVLRWRIRYLRPR